MTPLGVAATTVVGVLLVVAVVRVAHVLRRARRVAPARTRVEAELDRVRAASALLGQAQAHLGGRSLPRTLEELLHEVRGWLAHPPSAPAGSRGSLAEPQVIGLRAGDHADRDWLLLGADDAVRPAPRQDLPAALLRADTGRPAVLVPELPAGDGLDPLSRRGAYLWLRFGEGAVAVLALEWDRPGRFGVDEVRTLEVLRVLLEELEAAVARLHKLHDDAQAGERLRLAAQLHDQLGQDLAYLVVELSRAQLRHPDDGALPPLTASLRDVVTGVRTTIGELRRGAPRQVATPARRIAEALAPGVVCRLVADGASAPGDRAREDAAVACVVAIVGSVADRAPTVTIRGTTPEGSAAGMASLEIRLDGATVDVRQPAVVAARAAGEQAGVMVDVQGRPSGTWVIVRPAPAAPEGEPAVPATVAEERR